MSFHAAQTFTFGEQPSASKWQYIWDNDYALADGTGISDDVILTRHIANAQITPDLLKLQPGAAEVATNESTTTGTPTDLATAGPAVTVTIGANGLALILLSADLSNSTLNAYAIMGFVASGANTIAANSSDALYNKASVASNNLSMSWGKLITGLTPGSTTFTSKYWRVVGGTASFALRKITVIPL